MQIEIQDYISNSPEAVNAITQFKKPLRVIKSHCGIGGTTSFLQTDLPIILVVPNAGMAYSKEQVNTDPNVKFIHGEAQGKWKAIIEVHKYNPNIKIMCTWSSLSTLIEKNPTLGQYFMDNFFLVVDEYHCIYTNNFEGDNDFKIYDVINKWKLPYVLTTATEFRECIYSHLDKVYIYKNVPNKMIQMVIVEDGQVNEVAAKHMKTWTAISSNQTKMTKLLAPDSQVLSSEKFGLKVLKNTDNLITSKNYVDTETRQFLYTKKFHTGFDVHGKYHLIMIAEENSQADKFKVDNVSFYEIKQGEGRFRDGTLSTTLIYKNDVKCRNEHHIIGDIQNAQTIQEKIKFINELAHHDTYDSPAKFITNMSKIGFDVIIWEEDIKHTPTKNFIEDVITLVNNPELPNKIERVLNYIQGDAKHDNGISDKTILSYICANAIKNGDFTIEDLGTNTRTYRIIKRIIDRISNPIHKEFAQIQLYLKDENLFTDEKEYIEIMADIYDKIRKNITKLKLDEDVELRFQKPSLPTLLGPNFNKNTARYVDNEKIMYQIDKIKRSIQQAVYKKGNKLTDLYRVVSYTAESIKKQWRANMLLLFCTYHNLPTNHFINGIVDFREYNSITKCPKFLRYIYTQCIFEYDIKSAYASFIDIIYGENVATDVYQKIMVLHNITKAEAKIKYNKVINNHFDKLENIKKNLVAFGYSNKTVQDLAEKIKANKMFNILSEMEKEYVEKFIKESGVKKYLRVHDSIITFEKLNIHAQKTLEAEGVRFGGEYLDEDIFENY